MSHKTQIIRGWLKSSWRKFLKKLRGGSLKNCLRKIGRTESRILCALSQLDYFLLNSQVRTCSVAVPATSKNNNSEDRQPNGDRLLNDPCCKVVFSGCHSSNINDSEQEETHHMVTGVQEEIAFCFPGTSAGKQKKARSTIQPQFRTENTLATIETYQIAVAFQQLATNNNFANVNKTSKRFLKFPKTLSMTMLFLTGNQRHCIGLKICSKQIWKITINSRKKIKWTASTLLCVLIPYKHSKTSPAPTEEIWEEFRLCSVENT